MDTIHQGADLHENALFIEKRGFRSILVISAPSRPQKWIQLEISIILVVSGGLYVENKSISQKTYGSEGGWVARATKLSPNRKQNTQTEWFQAR